MVLPGIAVVDVIKTDVSPRLVICSAMSRDVLCDVVCDMPGTACSYALRHALFETVSQTARYDAKSY
eukprot:2279419-Rhodomonas_salina.2